MNELRRTLTRALALVTLIALSPGRTATEETSDFGVFPMSGSQGILLIVNGPALHPGSASATGGWIGYHIYRKSAQDTGFVRITVQPMSRVGSLEELEAVAGGPIDGLERLVGLQSKQELWRRLKANDSAVMALGVFSRMFYEAMGLLRWDAQVEQGKTYTYRATRVDSSGRESEPSQAMDATFGTPPFTLIGPLETNAVNDQSGIILTWKVNPDDSAAISYSVYRKATLEGAFLRLNRYPLVLTMDTAAGAAPSGVFVDSTAQQGRGYFYAIVSVDYAGNESPREGLLSIHVLDLTPPPIPQNVFGNPSEMGIVITWDKVNDPAVAGYHVYRSHDPDSFFVKISDALLPYDTGYYEDRSATSADRVFYRVTAVDQAGNESPRSARSLSLYENYVMPLPPQNVVGAQVENGIRVTWNRNDEPDLQGYYVFRADKFGGELSQISPLVSPDTTTYLDTSEYLSPRGQYWYLVQAINHTGITSQFSTPVSLSPGVTEQTEAPLSFFGYYENAGARLFWKTPDDNMVAGYHLYRATELDSLTWTKTPDRMIDRLVGEYIDSTVAPNAGYVYRICSVNPRGEESEPSHVVKITTFEAVAPAPGGVRVTLDVSIPLIKWTPSRLNDLRGYRVYRREEATPVVRLTDPLLPINTGDYRDRTAVKGKKYFYSISIVDIWGRESERSAEVEFLCR